ncbi:MAG: hypothetical protein M3O87_07220 [Candidatus Dormibacteraeota bacterium]|nr:hypothetical protein [Candidatus Dormibacteraeota bacterium]
MRTLGRVVAFGVGLLDGTTAIVAFFIVVVLVTLGRLPHDIEPIFYGALGVLFLAIIVAAVLTRGRRRNSR